MATIRKGNSLNNTAERYQNKMLDDVGEVLRLSLRTEEFQPLQDNSDNQQKASLSTAYPRKVHGYGEKRIRMDFSRPRCHLGQLFLQMGRLYAKKKVLENPSTSKPTNKPPPFLKIEKRNRSDARAAPPRSCNCKWFFYGEM